MLGNAVVVNFAGGETSPRSRGRFDQPWYQTSAKKMFNFIADLPGPSRYRPGFVYAFQTRKGLPGRIIDFVINDTLAYLLEFTSGYLRIRNPITLALLTTTQATITGITKAASAVVTVSSATGLVNGQEVILADIVGMAELNGRQFLISGLSGSTFTLTDPVTNVVFDSSQLTTYSSGGTASVVQEVATPYSDLDLDSLQVAATNGIMYLTCPRQVPQKITVDAYENFAISSYVRTNDPFALSAVAVTIADVRPIDYGDKRIGAAATLTPAAVTGTGIVFTASAVAFTSADVGKYLRVVPAAGVAKYGYALITAFTNNTHVVCTVITDFDSTGAIASGSWEVVTIETQVTLASSSVVNASLTYLISAVGGATQMNGNTYYLVALDKPGTTSSQKFLLRSTLNASINSSAWGTYTSGGTATPTSSQPSLTVTGITTGTTTRVAFATGYSFNPNVGYTFSAVGGTIQINGGTYWLEQRGSHIYITTADGSDVDSSAWTAYTTGGIATASTENPISVTFYEGRLVFAGTNQRPDCLFLSRSPDSSGNSRYDDFTGGTDADHACFFQLAPSEGSSAFISWVRGGPDYLFTGTFGGPYRVSGGGLDIPITPSSINVRQFDTAGCEQTMPCGLAQMFFVQRAGKTVRGIKVINPILATFESTDMCLNAEQVGYSSITRAVLQRGRPDAVWVCREDGQLAGMSVKITGQAAEQLTGWHRHELGNSGAVVDVAVMPRQGGYDQLWVLAQHVVGGYTRCYVGVMADDVEFPDPEDFFGKSGTIALAKDDPPRETDAASGSRAEDIKLWGNAVWRKQADYVHLDAEASYDGSLRGTAVSATLTPSAVGAPQTPGQAAVTITLTASQGVFLSSDVGSEIWVKPNAITGLGGGRAKITGYTSATLVTAQVLVAFESVAAVAAGDWYFAVSTFYGFGHIEGETPAIVADGAVVSDGGLTPGAGFPSIQVTNGKIVLPSGSIGQQQRAAVLRAGFPYLGMTVTHNLEMGGRTGPAQAKPRAISDLYIRFMNSLGVQYGTDLYNLECVDHRLSNARSDRPAPVFSGLRRVKMRDSWSGVSDQTNEKNVYVVQRLPLPAVIQGLDIEYNTTDMEGDG